MLPRLDYYVGRQVTEFKLGSNDAEKLGVGIELDGGVEIAGPVIDDEIEDPSGLSLMTVVYGENDTTMHFGLVNSFTQSIERQIKISLVPADYTISDPDSPLDEPYYPQRTFETDPEIPEAPEFPESGSYSTTDEDEPESQDEREAKVAEKKEAARVKKLEAAELKRQKDQEASLAEVKQQSQDALEAAEKAYEASNPPEEASDTPEAEKPVEEAADDN